MNNTAPSRDSSADLQLSGEFRRLPLSDLEYFPSSLFDPDSAPEPPAESYGFVPLIVYKAREESGGFIVVDGCKRLRSARAQGLAACNCIVITPTPDGHTAALLRITLNRGRSLDFVEKYLFVKWLKEHCDDSGYHDMSRRLPVDERQRFEFERLAGCEADVVAAVREGALDIANAVQAGYLEPAERLPVFALLRRYPFSRQMQRELFDWLPELAFREKCTVAEITTAPWLREIENNHQLNGPQKIDHLRAALFNRRFPTLAKTKKYWDELAAKFNPDRSLVQLKPSDAFEKNRLEIKIAVTSGEQAHELFGRLAEIPAENWDRLIYPVFSGEAATS